MTKAILTSVDMSARPLEDFAINDYNGNTVSKIHGPMAYTYNLTYISYEPISMGDFPAEINTEEIPVMIKDLPKEEKKKLKITNPILQSLEI